MVDLIKQWDAEASKIDGAQKLSTEDFMRSQHLAKVLLESSQEELSTLREAHRLRTITDDNNNIIRMPAHLDRFLPQTYVSASLLLSLSDHRNIIAIPRGMRTESHLYPFDIMNKIPIDTDRFNVEKIYQRRPQIAFVSNYSLPSMLQVFRKQNIPLFFLNNLDSIPDIRHAIARIGHITNRPFKAELLNIFIDAALIAIDNTVLHTKRPSSLLYLNIYSGYATPAPGTLTNRFLKRLHIQHPFPQKCSHMKKIALTREDIVMLDPECIIVSIPQKHNAIRTILNDRAFQNLRAVKNNRIFAVDEIAQESSDHHIVLAYYDLAQILLQSES